jgi:hypothetical protein
MKSLGYNPDTRKLTLTATLAAVYVIFRAIPIDRLVGINGIITAAGMVAPILGLLLEPAYAVTAVFTGTLVASEFPWNPLKFAGLDFLPGALNVILVSLMVHGRRTEGTLAFLGVIGLFVINPFTRIFVGSAWFSPPVPFLWMHILALVVLVSPLSRNLTQRLSSSNKRDVVGGIAVLAFVGTMIEHLTGGVLTAVVFGKGIVGIWPAAFVLYPIERTILVIGAVLICTPVLLALKGSVEARWLTALAKPTLTKLEGASGVEKHLASRAATR